MAVTDTTQWRGPDPEEPGPLEKMALADMRPDKLRRASDDEVRLAWLRLNQWYAAARRRGDATETIVNAAIWVMNELSRRGYEIDAASELAREVEQIRKVDSPAVRLLEQLPEEVLLIQDFVSLVGSAVKETEPADIDVLFRANRDESGNYFLLQADSVWLPVRKVLDPDKRGGLHFVDAPQGSHDDYIPIYSLVLRREEPTTKVIKGTAERMRVSPGKRFEVQKPLMAGTTEFFSTDELWPWVEEKLAQGVDLAGEVKFDGFRCVLSWNGEDVWIWFEDAQNDRSEVFPSLVQACRNSGYHSFVLDGEMLATHKGELVPRTQLMELLANEPRCKPVYCVFDCLYFEEEDISSEPLWVRRDRASKVVEKLGEDCKLSRSLRIKSRKDLESVGRWAASQPGSEGLMVKNLGGSYVFGGSDDWAKLKTVVELKVAVLEVKEVENGYTYRCGLLAAGPYGKCVEVDGKNFVDLGKTFVTKDRVADVGDTLNVRVEELIVMRGDEGPELAWGKPTVVGPDRSRTAYSATQAVDLARRGHVLKKEVAKVDVPPKGTDGKARIAFVAASPGKVEAARREPLCGPSGEMFREAYLRPLGLNKDEVFITYLVPDLLVDDRGLVREPNEMEIDARREQLLMELEGCGAPLVIALGQRAKTALAGRCDFVLPHPVAVRRYGDSGELARKLVRIKQALASARKDDEGDTRGAKASRYWNEHWHEAYPTSGRGRFIYHHHWRGLSEAEVGLDEEALLRTGHSLHGDLRLEGRDGLWGVSVFLGTAESNRRAGGDRLIGLQSGDSLQVQFKLQQPKEWLRIGIEQPHISAPGGAGATANKFAKFYALDHGTYEMGVWREHMLEIFLHGERLQGRYLIEYAPVAEGGKRVWLINKPENQTPYADRHELADVMSELERKGQRWLVWCKPGEKPQLMDVRVAQKADGGSYTARILKADDERQLVYGVVLQPDVADSQGDIVPAEEIEEAAHRYLVRSRVVGDRHNRLAAAEVVESYIVPVDIEIEGQPVKAGSWVLVTHISDPSLWEAVKSGTYTSYSIGGFGLREEVMPDA